jgi:hypothetical protein
MNLNGFVCDLSFYSNFLISNKILLYNYFALTEMGACGSNEDINT